MQNVEIPLNQHERCYEGGEIKHRQKHSGDNSQHITALSSWFFVLYRQNPKIKWLGVCFIYFIGISSFLTNSLFNHDYLGFDLLAILIKLIPKNKASAGCTDNKLFVILDNHCIKNGFVFKKKSTKNFHTINVHC